MKLIYGKRIHFIVKNICSQPGETVKANAGADKEADDFTREEGNTS